VLRIALTGGACSGKTALSTVLGARFGDQVRVVAESALHVFNTHAIRDFNIDDQTRRRLQREIYQTQLSWESLPENDAAARVMITDRGTVDGAAYWPDGPEAFWSAMGTSQAREIGRYEAVVWLETAAVLGVFDAATGTAYTREHPDEAIRIGKRILDVWAPHPHLTRVRATADFAEKERTVVAIVARAIGAPT
jgi:hypothetical protein